MNKQKYTFDLQSVDLIDIESVTLGHHVNGIDLEVHEDQTFTLGDGLISHNSAAKSIQGGRGDNPYIGSFPLRGKVLNVRDKDVTRVLGLDKKKEKEKEGKKTEPTEIQKIMTVLGLTIGEKVEFIDEPDGEWIEISIDGRKMHVNEADDIEVDGEKIPVRSLLV